MSVTAPGGDGRRNILVLALLALLVALPLALLALFPRIERPWADARPAPPNYLVLPPVRGSSGDGAMLRARLAVDVDDAATRRAIEQQPQQIQLLLEAAIGTRSRAEIAAEGGLDRLAGELRERLNDYLAQAGAAPVKQVIVQDLLFTAP